MTKSLEVSQHLLPFPPARPRPRARSLTRATKQGLVKDLDELTEKVRTPFFGTLNVLLREQSCQVDGMTADLDINALLIGAASQVP